jgi:ParB-like chromosome segregation protein Spo0J
MPPILKKPINAASKVTTAGKVAMRSSFKESSRMKVFEIPLNLIVDHSENPNEQSESTFDELSDRVGRDGPDEPIIVVPEIVKGKPTGKYLIVSGHHRKKAYAANNLKTVDAIIREGWDEDRAAIELITRNQLRGQVNPYKFTELFDRLNKRYDKEQLKKMMGLTEKKAFNALYKRISDNLNPKQKRKLEEAKEKIHSIDDLSSVLHQIFKEQGSELEDGMMVFSYGGKKNFYIKVGDESAKQLEEIQKTLESRDQDIKEFFRVVLNHAYHEKLAEVPPSANVSKQPDPPKPVPAKGGLRKRLATTA